MSTRLFIDLPLNPNTSITLPKDAHHHLVTVCRGKVGDRITLFNNTGFEFMGSLTNASKKESTVFIESQHVGLNPSPLTCHLGIGISAASRFDLALQKATELGVSSITPLITQKSVRHHHSDKKQEHWEKIIVSACEQSGRCEIPTCNAPILLSDWCSDRKEECKLICSLQQAPITLAECKQPSSLALLIGPASGFTDDEEQLAISHDFQCISLGPRTLRTETACFSAVTLVQTQWGDM